ncbi:MAG: 30S ribosomal protein S12 methylthiotransferase RimO [Clostridiales bacterium]|nr:30S ribosomal protein S12 methylthiotransferase RimO [Clostridiales bacterium]
MKVGLLSLGCAKNQVDSEHMLYMLREMGHQIVSDEKDAQVIIINTCGFIDSAKEEAIDAILSAVQLKEEGLCQKVMVTGCLAQRYGESLMEEIPEIDGLIGVEQYQHFKQFFEDTVNGARPMDISRTQHTLECGRVLTTPPFTAYVRIAEGCDNRCHYCAIPLIRGNYRSRSADAIIGEMEQLSANGVREHIFIAQDTTRYGRDRGEKNGLAALLRRAHDVKGVDWLRVLYLYPEDVDDELVDAMAALPNFCRYLDVPLQHASPKMLREMNRRGDIAKIEKTLLRARSMGFALRTTFIVGYPGETEEDFEQLMDFTRRMEFDRMGAFAYSPEEDTVGGEREDQIDDAVKQQRLDRLMTLQADISLRRNQQRVGKTETLLVTEVRPGGCVCRSTWEAPDADGLIFVRDQGVPGEMRRAVITEADTYDLTARWID